MVKLLWILLIGTLAIEVLSVVDKESTVLRAAIALSLANGVLGLDYGFVFGLWFIIGDVVILESVFEGLVVIFF